MTRKTRGKEYYYAPVVLVEVVAVAGPVLALRAAVDLRWVADLMALEVALAHARERAQLALVDGQVRVVNLPVPLQVVPTLRLNVEHGDLKCDYLRHF